MDNTTAPLDAIEAARRLDGFGIELPDGAA